MSQKAASFSGDLSHLCASAPVVMPSVLQCDFGNLEREIGRLEEAGAKGLHLDVMDGNFVPNLSFGFPVIEAIRRLTELPLDVHLMIANPTQYVARYVEAGADIVTVHAEVLDDPRPLLQEIRALGARAGLAINPPTPLDTIAAALPLCDLVLVMSVMPGFGGQSLDQIALKKLRDLRSRVPKGTVLEVDGGVNEETIVDCVAAGAQLLVVGSAITGQADYAASMARLRALASMQ
ncbi:MAG: ribulose-phosphate 3-epimerase [Pirellulales bacterium]|nr:ribulose-phosphate 3-epimerase [Pirellulales bacterium]